jgi:hypothetical protein
MSHTVSLSKAYQHPGFVPELLARIEDDAPDTFILPLRRGLKKTPVEGVGKLAVPTITSSAKAATSIAAAGQSSWSSSSGGSAARGAA